MLAFGAKRFDSKGLPDYTEDGNIGIAEVVNDVIRSSSLQGVELHSYISAFTESIVPKAIAVAGASQGSMMSST